MSDLGALSKESVKSLGTAAYLINVLPSAVFILSLAALIDSRLLPWSQPRFEGDEPIARGPASVLDAFTDRGLGGGVLLGLSVLVLAVLLRPFQIGTVQLIEGYWRRGGLVKALAVERHSRRATATRARARVRTQRSATSDFTAVARYAKQVHRASVLKTNADSDRWRYPYRLEWVMPTALGNVLRRAETTAGERYGLGTVDTYPRLYPYLSPRLDAEVNEQLNGIDVMATFVVVFTVQALVSSPLLWWLNWWSLTPLALAILAALAYRGAIAAAGRYGQLLAASFDLHRFDMTAAMRLPSHANADAEYEANIKLTRLFQADRPWPPEQRRTWTYAHPAGIESGLAELLARRPDPGAADGGAERTESGGTDSPPDKADPAEPTGHVDDHSDTT